MTRTLLLIIALFSSLSSCRTVYYYAEMDTNNPYTENDENGNFVVESDSLAIIYSFHGENAPVKITVKNKMKRVLYVDWNRSVFIFGDDDNNRVIPGQYMESWQTPQIVGLGREVTKELFELTNLNLDKADYHSFGNKSFRGNNGKMLKMKTGEYFEENTPLFIRNLLVLNIGSEDETLFFEQDFYISRISRSYQIKPEKLAAYGEKRGNFFFTRKEQGRQFAEAMSITGGILLITGEIILHIAGEDN